jgi:hypothetical protein
MDVFLDKDQIIVKISGKSLETIVERLKDSEIGYCQKFDDHTVQMAFCNWFDHFLNDIEDEPEQFIKHHKKTFLNSLPDVDNVANVDNVTYQDVQQAA